jgi:ubiquinone/menaquinone biosynthesis C-methylase UbiE
MEYSEQTDFDEKSQVLTTLLKRFEHYQFNGISPKATVLELGGSGGVFGGLLSNSVGRVIVSDIMDTQVQYQGEFPKLLKEKFLRNGHDFSFGKIEFHVADAMKLPYRDDYFDLVVSVNAFEHIPDPIMALREALRVTKREA